MISLKEGLLNKNNIKNINRNNSILKEGDIIYTRENFFYIVSFGHIDLLFHSTKELGYAISADYGWLDFEFYDMNTLKTKDRDNEMFDITRVYRPRILLKGKQSLFTQQYLRNAVRTSTLVFSSK